LPTGWAAEIVNDCIAMKSTEVYATLKADLAPAFKAAGFKRAKGLLSWARRRDDRYLVAWCQVSQSGWDDYAGSRFTVEFQLSDEAIVGTSAVHRQRFSSMLSDGGREEMREIQNRVIACLPTPPASHPLLHISAAVRAYYLKSFQRTDQPYSEREDVWLSYRSTEDVNAWAQFIIRNLPVFFKCTEAWR
jgi:hypothetical protein